MNAMNNLRTSSAIMSAFNGKRRLRKWSNTHYGGMEAAKEWPLAMCAIRPDEGGTIQTNLNVKLAPVAAYMSSSAYVDVKQIFVPYQAIEKMWLSEQEDAGVTEMTRRRMEAGQVVGLAGTSDISRACNIHPKTVGAHANGDLQLRVSGTVYRAYNCAVNHLRKVAYHKAEQLGDTDVSIAPAVLTANVLDRYNGVNDPEKLVDGAINLTGELAVTGIGRLETDGDGAIPEESNVSVVEHDGTVKTYDSAAWAGRDDTSQSFFVELGDNAPHAPQLKVGLSGADEISLRSMIESQKLDRLVRYFAKLIEQNPTHGEDMVARAIQGLSVDFDSDCQVVYRKVFELTPKHYRPTDGDSINEISAHYQLDTSFATMVPRSELGGQLVTLVSVKPLETVGKQPDPFQTSNWELVNRIHDETQLDEQLVVRGDLESAVDAADKDQPVFWIGHNGLRHDYVTACANEHETPQVQLQSSMWEYQIPTGVDETNVNYPEDFAQNHMYPFYNWNGPHAEYVISQRALISTHLAKGPDPVERIQLLADDPSLVHEEE